MKVYLVQEDYGQDNGTGIHGIFATLEEAIALVRELNPRYKVNWPWMFDIIEWELGKREETQLHNSWVVPDITKVSGDRL